MGILRKRSKTKGATAQTKQPEKKKPTTRVAEFEFKHGIELKPGGVITYSGRQSGKSIFMQEEILRLMKDMPRFEYTPPQPNQFGDWGKTVDNVKLEKKLPKETALESWAEKWARENQ